MTTGIIQKRQFFLGEMYKKINTVINSPLWISVRYEIDVTSSPSVIKKIWFQIL